MCSAKITGQFGIFNTRFPVSLNPLSGFEQVWSGYQFNLSDTVQSLSENCSFLAKKVSHLRIISSLFSHHVYISVWYYCQLCLFVKLNYFLIIPLFLWWWFIDLFVHKLTILVAEHGSKFGGGILNHVRNRFSNKPRVLKNFLRDCVETMKNLRERLIGYPSCNQR